MLKLALTVLLAVSGIMNANGQAAPWCDGYHYFQNSTTGGYTATNYIIALEQVRIRSGSTVLFNMPADGFSGSTNCGQEWRLANSPAQAINITAGNTYTVDASSSSANTYSASLGVFIDYNNDKDFLDAGEYLGSFTNGSSQLTPSPLASRTFTVPCNITPSATRMRVVCNYNGYPMQASYGCHGCSGTPYYGETAALTWYFLQVYQLISLHQAMFGLRQ